MRNFFVLLLTNALGLALLASPSAAQKFEQKKPEDPEKVLESLLKAVKDKDNIDARINAIVGLAEFGPKAAPALPDLIDALKTKNEDLRLNAAITLGKIGAPAVKSVAKLLKSKDDDTKFYAIWTLGWIGPDAKETVPAMIKLAGSKNEGIRRKAIFALGRLAGDPDKTIDVLVAAFKDESDEVRQAAGDALAKFGKPAVEPLIGLLKSDNPKAQMQASISLGEIGSEAKEAVPHLKDLYLAKTGSNPHHYAQMLAKIGKAGVPALEAGLRDLRPDVRQAASQSLQAVGADAVPVLIDALSDKNVEVRRMAAQTLQPMNIGDKSVVIALAFALADGDDQVRLTCMDTLNRLGAQAKLAAPKLKEALSDMHPQIRIQAFQLLSTLNENPGPTLVKALASKNEKIRINTACLMVTTGIERDAATPILVDALENKNLGLKMQAASTLAQQQLQKDKVLPIFLNGLKHEAAGVRLQAVQGVTSFGQNAASVAPELAKMLLDSDANVRNHTIYGLQQVRGSVETVLPILTGIFKEGSPESRRNVMQVVHIYGDKSVDLVADGLRDKDDGVRQQAVQAVHQLRANGEKMVPILTKIYKEGDAGAKRTVLSVAYIYGGKAKDLVFDGLKDKDASVKQQAIFTLQNLQGDLTEALPAIAAYMKEKDSGINRQQFVYLFARAGDAGVPYLGDLVKDADPNVRVVSLQHLRNMGAKAAKVAPAMRGALKDGDSNVRLWAMLTLVSSGSEGTEFLVKHFGEEKDANVRSSLLQNIAYNVDRKFGMALLPTAMKDPSAQVRQQTVNLIGLYGQQSKEGFDVFLMGLKDADNQVRINAANHGNYFGQKSWPPFEEAIKSAKDAGFRQALLQSLHGTGYRSKTSVMPLIECLKDSNTNVQNLACIVLGNIGPDATDALPALRKIAADSGNQAVQNSARNAVQRIAPKDK